MYVILHRFITVLSCSSSRIMYWWSQEYGEFDSCVYGNYFKQNCVLIHFYSLRRNLQFYHKNHFSAYLLPKDDFVRISSIQMSFENDECRSQTLQVSLMLPGYMDSLFSSFTQTLWVYQFVSCQLALLCYPKSVASLEMPVTQPLFMFPSKSAEFPM